MTYRFISLRETTSKRGNTAACAAYQTKDDRVFLHSGATPRCAHSRACARQARQHYTHCGVFAVPPQRFPCSLTTRCNVRKSGHSPILFNCALSLLGPLRSKSPRKATRIKPSIDLLRNGIADKPRLVSALMASHLYHWHKLSPSVPSRNISPTSGSHRVAKNSGRGRAEISLSVADLEPRPSSMESCRDFHGRQPNGRCLNRDPNWFTTSGVRTLSGRSKVQRR